MKNDRRLWLKALAALPFAGVLPALADEGLEAIRKRGSLRIAVYNDFPPYATSGGKGIDADIARAIAGPARRSQMATPSGTAARRPAQRPI